MAGLFVTFLISMAASYVIGKLLYKEPEGAVPDDQDPYRSPQSKPGFPVPVIYGTRRIRSINVLWYGLESNTPITERVKKASSLRGSTKKVTVAYKYHIAIQFGICLGFEGMTLKSVYFGDDLLVSGSVGGESVMPFSQPKLYGGDKQGGGVVGTCRFTTGMGAMSVPPVFTYAYGDRTVTIINDSGITNPQTPAEVMAMMQEYEEVTYNVPVAGTIPLYRNLATIMMSNQNQSAGFYYGTQKSGVRPVSVVVSNTQYMAGAEAPNGLDVNPMAVLESLMVDDQRFANQSGVNIDVDSIRDAGTVLETEGLFFSPMFAQTKSLEGMVNVILKFVDGVFYADPLSGKMTMKLLRDTDKTGSELVLDTSNLKKILKHKKESDSNRINEVKLTYTARDHNYEDRTVTAQDLGGFITNGSRYNTRSVDYPSITTLEVARKICDRELKYSMVDPDILRVEVNREFGTTVVGDIIIVDLPEQGIDQEFFRVADVDYGTLLDGAIILELLSDRTIGSDVLYDDTQETLFEDPIATQVTEEITNGVLFEVPYSLLDLITDWRLSFDSITEFWNPILMATQSSKNNYGFDIYTQLSDSGSYALTESTATFTPRSILVNDYPVEDAMWDTSLSLVIYPPDIDLAQGDVSNADNLIQGLRFALIGGREWILFSEVVDLLDGTYSLNNVHRGMFDTSPRHHDAGSTLLFVSDNLQTLSESGFSIDEITKVEAKLVPYGVSGLMDIGDVTASIPKDYLGYQLLPLPPANVQFEGNYYRPDTNPIYGDTSVTFLLRNKTEISTIVIQNSPPHVLEANTTYYVKVFEADGTTLLREVTGLTVSPYLYTIDFQLADHGQLDPVLVFEVGSTDSVNGDCVYPRIQEINYAGYGYDYGNNYGT